MRRPRITPKSWLSVYLRPVCSGEAILIDLQRPDLRFQGGTRYTQLHSRTGGSVYSSSAFAQRSLNDCFLRRRNRLRESKSPVQLSRKELAGKPTLIDCEILRFTYNHRS